MWSFKELVTFIFAQIKSLVLPGSLQKNCTYPNSSAYPDEFINDQPSAKYFLSHLSKTQSTLIVVGTLATSLLILIGLIQARLINRYVSEKKHRKLLLVMAFLFPGAGILCLTGMFVPRAATINASFGLFVFVVAIASLVRLCRYLTGGWHQLAAELNHVGHRMSLRNPPFCCILPCLPRATATEKNLRCLDIAVIQAPFVRAFVLLIQIVVIAEFRDKATTFVQLCDVVTLFSLLALVFAFHTLSRAASSSLKQYGYNSLFRLIDFGLLFFSAQEPLIFENIFVRFGAIGCGTSLSPHDYARFICNFVIIIELFVLSLIACYLLRPTRSLLFDDHPRHQYLAACSMDHSHCRNDGDESDTSRSLLVVP